MNAYDPIDALLAALAEKTGIDPLLVGEDGVSILSFDEVDVLLARDEQALILFARLGMAPQGDSDFLEALLAANLFWQETGGATLSLEPYSRTVVMARRLVRTELDSVDTVEAAIETLARSAIEWTRTIHGLAGASGAETTVAAALVASAQRV